MPYAISLLTSLPLLAALAAMVWTGCGIITRIRLPKHDQDYLLGLAWILIKLFVVVGGTLCAALVGAAAITKLAQAYPIAKVGSSTVGYLLGLMLWFVWFRLLTLPFDVMLASKRARLLETGETMGQLLVTTARSGAMALLREWIIASAIWLVFIAHPWTGA